MLELIKFTATNAIYAHIGQHNDEYRANGWWH